MTRLVAAVVALLAFPAAAGAAPLGELPFEQRKGITGCVEATGAPGGLSVMGPYSRRASSTDLLTAAGGRTARVSLGRLLDCAAVAEAPGGAAIVAGAAVSRASGDYRAAMRVAVRDPGGAFGPASGLDDSFGRPAVAIAPSGAAVVAWVAGEDRPDAVRRLVVARRPPGGAFGAPETVLSWNPPLYLSWELHAGIDDAGTSTVLLSRDVVDERGDARNIEVATAAADAPFATQVLAERVEGGGEPVLAIAPDGWAIVAHGRAERQPPSVFERAPGASFTPVTLPEAPGPRRVIRD
ncbi:MAG TPA: hypothetical protein VNO82_17520, partial [Solirubrobacteraceae bacterium]|nr:hypothetical protein [Solirubrobacteraceae bacterium]